MLRHHELHLFQGWEEWIRSLAHNLVNQSSPRHGSIQVIQDYNAQASNFKLEALSLFRPCFVGEALGAADNLRPEITG